MVITRWHGRVRRDVTVVQATSANSLLSRHDLGLSPGTGSAWNAPRYLQMLAAADRLAGPDGGLVDGL